MNARASLVCPATPACPASGASPGSLATWGPSDPTGGRGRRGTGAALATLGIKVLEETGEQMDFLEHLDYL